MKRHDEADCRTCEEFFHPGGTTREDEQKMIRDAIDCLRAAHQEADDRGIDLPAAYRRLDAGVRGALGILRRSSKEPIQSVTVAPRVREG